MSDDDKRWLDDQLNFGWALPFVAAWPLRLPIIRWFRAVYYDWQVHRSASAWGAIGIGAGVPQYDRWVVYAIARGWA